MPRRFELLVFDWDGTLMDSTPAITAALQAACSDLALPVPTVEQARYVIGLGLTDAMRHLLPELPSGEYGLVVDRYRQHFLLRDATTTLFPGAAQMIRELHDAGFQLAVATGKSRRGLDRALEATGVGAYFHMTQCVDEGFAKPHPGMLYAVMDHLARTADSTLMIGDTTHDLAMAQAAGVAALAVTYGAHERAALRDHRPLALIDAPLELHHWLTQHA